MFSLHLLIRIILFVVIGLMSACSFTVPSFLEKEFSLQGAEQQQLVPGLTYFQINRGQASGHFLLNSAVMPLEQANLLIQKLEKFNATVSKAPTVQTKSNVISTISPVELGPKGNILGQLVTYGQFDTLLQAQQMQQELDAIGIHFTPTHSTQRGIGAGKQEISILKLEPSLFSGKLISALANDSVLDLQQTSKIAQLNDAVAAVNGGFFAYQAQQGVVGDVAGISVIDGTLVSEAVNGRPALLIKNTPSLSVDILENVHSNVEMHIDGQQFKINGINRQSGKIFNCGQNHGDTAVAAIHDYVCTELNEIILYNEYFGDLELILNESEFQFFLDENDKVYFSLPGANKRLPQGHHLVSASGKYAEILRNIINLSSSVSISQRIWSNAGELTLAKGMYLINGGPTLLTKAEMPIAQRAVEGWDTAPVNLGSAATDSRDTNSQIESLNVSRINFYQNWVLQRHPRTAVGVTAAGTVFVVVVYGRDPQRSIGASVSEMAEIMKGLGAIKALNLDGGGSSVMVVDGKITGKPSDTNGERSVAEALLFIAAKKV